MGRSHRPLPEQLPQKLYFIRRHLKLTQEQMVERLQDKMREHYLEPVPIFPGHISEYERGMREPPLIVLLQYARIAGVAMDNLVDDGLDLPGFYFSYVFTKRKRIVRKKAKT